MLMLPFLSPPLPSVHPSPLDQSVIYSSSPASSQIPSGHHMYRAQGHDAFMGRPRTSHAFHAPPFAPSAVPRQSMNEHQLRALLPLNGPYQGHTAPFAPPPSYGAPLPVPTSPLRGVPPQFTAPHIGKTFLHSICEPCLTTFISS